MRILYVEDRLPQFQDIEKALGDSRMVGHPPLELRHAASPDDLTEDLLENVDVVLADVFFPVRKDPSESDISRQKTRPRLGDIIKRVQQHDEKRAKGGNRRRTLIIAYSVRGSLKEITPFEDDLFDVWDKHTADPAYVAWRLRRLAQTTQRLRPDHYLREAVARCNDDAFLKRDVSTMLERYDGRWTEGDQVDQAGGVVEEILSTRGMHDLFALWQVMPKWELLGRAVSPVWRGHARHVLNVFWLGYVLLNDPGTANLMRELWKKSCQRYDDLPKLQQMDAGETLNLAWFYAAVFHDIAYCVEQSSATLNVLQSLIKNFEPLATTQAVASVADIKRDSERLIDRLFVPEIAVRVIVKAIEAAAASGKPDHGMVAALTMIRRAEGTRDAEVIKVAAEAVALHNVLADVTTPVIEWSRHPLAATLLLADQLQTWDRERDDQQEKRPEDDRAQRAELTHFAVEPGIVPTVRLHINYIGPEHLQYAPALTSRERRRLEGILRAKPVATLSRLGGEWPFALGIKCFLDGAPLNVNIELPLPR